MKKIFTLIAFLCLIANINAQIVVQESFDNTTFPPSGWLKTKIYPAEYPDYGNWVRVTNNTYPITVTPHSGTGMASFNSITAGNGTIAELSTPSLNFSTGLKYRVRFWLYRMSSYSTNDRLEININTQPNSTGAVVLSTILIGRRKTPVENADGWYEYIYDLPASFNTNVNYIIFRATSESGNIVFLDDLSVEAIACHKPESQTISNVGTTTATLSWTAPVIGSPDGYEWELRTSGSAGTGNTGLIASGSTSSSVLAVALSGLTQGGNYNCYIRSVCGTDKSTWTDALSFMTLCNAFTIPYNENFDALTIGTPNCFTVANVNGGNTWTSSYPTYGSYSGTNAIVNLNGGTGSSGLQDDWFFTAPLNLEAGKCYKLSFRMIAGYSTYYQNLRIRIGTNQTIASMDSQDLLNVNNYTTNSFQLQTAYFTVTQSGVYYLGFENYSDVLYSSGFLTIDDISVIENIGAPVSLTLSSAEITTATINWNVPSCGTPTSYSWELRTSGTAGGGSFGLINSGSTGILSVPLSGLTDNTNYSFYVRAVNGNLQSEWSSALNFKTGCAVKSIPYYENFDAIFAPNFPYCYNVQDITVPYNTWNTWNTNYGSSNSYPNCLKISTSNSTSSGNNWLFTPPLLLVAGKSYRLSFYYHNSVYYYDEKLEVKYGKSANSSYMITPIYSNTDIRNPFYKKAVVDFVPSENGNFNLGFHYISNSSRNGLYVDDIKVDETPKCDTVYDIKVKNITTQGVTINWSLPISGTPNGFIWELRTTGNAGSGSSGLISDGSLATATKTLTVTGLTSSTNYTFYIKSVCGTDSSDWVAAAFSTACLPLSIPYTESFSSLSANNLPGCTTIEETKDLYNWYVISSYHYSAPYALLHEGSSLSLLDDWFFSAPLDLKAGKSYHLSFYTKQIVSGYTDALEIYTGNFAQSESMSVTPIYVNNSISNTSYQLMSVDFTVSADGTYYLGFRWKPNNYTRAVVIDDISVTENTATAIRDVATPANDLLLSVYPNPTEGELMLKINRKYDAGKAVINIRDLQGRAVKKIEMKLTGSGNYLLQTTGLPPGMYLVEVLQSQSGRKQTVTIRKK